MINSARFIFVWTLCLTQSLSAQVAEDRPKVLDSQPLTRDQLNQKRVTDLQRQARTLYGLGLLHSRKEKLIEATTTLEKALSLDSESLEIRRLLAPLYAMIGRDDDAMAQCQKILDREPTDLDIAFQYSRLLKMEGRTLEAITVLQKAIRGKTAQERPERLLVVLNDLHDLLESRNDFTTLVDTLELSIKTATEKKEIILNGNGFYRDDLQHSIAKTYERLGRSFIKLKEYDKSVRSFKKAREEFAKIEDPEARHQAVRINWNLSEIAYSRGQFEDALDALEMYLKNYPNDLDPYRRKIELLEKLGRHREIIPFVRKIAAREEFNLGLQLLLCEELVKEPRSRQEAETLYLSLLEKHIKPEVYRGLFELYRVQDRMEKVLDLIDNGYRVLATKVEETPASERESMAERVQTMLTVLRTEKPLVSALLSRSLSELTKDRRHLSTWSLLANLAARTRDLEKAELLFRQCLQKAPRDVEASVYLGLIQVLQFSKKYEEIVALCRNALNGPRAAQNTHAVIFYSSLATAYAELGKFDEALSAADGAIKVSSEDGKVRAISQKAEIFVRAGRFNDAIRICNETMKEYNRPSMVKTLRFAMSSAYSAMGDHRSSEEQLKLILETDPTSALANNNLGYQLAERNINLDEAEKMIRLAIDVDRSVRRQSEEDVENAAYLDSLGWVLFRKNQLPESRKHLEKAAALPDGADDPTVWEHLGDVYFKMQELVKATEAWKKALKLYEQTHRVANESRKGELDKKIRLIESSK